MAKAHYLRHLKEINGKKFIVIVDLNQGGKSVTNDIENVVEEIARVDRINPNLHLIIYRDTDLSWDGWNANAFEFIPLNAKTEREAANELISYMRLQKSW